MNLSFAPRYAFEALDSEFAKGHAYLGKIGVVRVAVIRDTTHSEIDHFQRQLVKAQPEMNLGILHYHGSCELHAVSGR